MLKRMRYYNSVADRELKKGEEADRGIVDGALKAANEAAKDAAPYIHARLSAIEHTGSPVDAIAEMLRLIDGTSRGLPDPARIPKDRDEIIDVTPTQVAPHPQAPVAKPPPEAAPRMKTLLSKPTNSPSADTSG